MQLPSRREAARGQILIVAVLALVAIVGMVGLVIDGGALFAQQRIAQNGADGAATSGAVVIAEYMGGATTRNNQNVYDAVNNSATANELESWTAEYTDDFGDPLVPAVPVVPGAGAIPAGAEGVRAIGVRSVSTSFSRIFGFDEIPASAEATVVAGPLSAECIADDSGCSVLPITFPVQVSECDLSGSLIQGNWVGAPPPGHETEGYWPLVGAESLPTSGNPAGDKTPPKYAILPFCKSSSGGSGAFGKLDLAPGMNFPQEIVGPINVTIDLPGWFQTQPGNVESVDGELSAWIHKPILIPLNNGACRINPGPGIDCPLDQEGVDPVGNNTWYYVHTLAVFYIDQVLIQGSEGDDCNNAPGTPLVPTTDTGAGFLGCIKGWFINYVTAGPIIPGQDIEPGTVAIGIQLIK